MASLPSFAEGLDDLLLLVIIEEDQLMSVWVIGYTDV
jgi:hypothetical protein